MGAAVTWAPGSITVTQEWTTCLKDINLDFDAIPNTALALSVVALFTEDLMTIPDI